MTLHPEGKPVGKPFRDYLGRTRVLVELPKQEPPLRKVIRQHVHTYRLGGNEQRVEHSHAVRIDAPEHMHGSKEDRNGAT